MMKRTLSFIMDPLNVLDLLAVVPYYLTLLVSATHGHILCIGGVMSCVVLM